MTIISLKRENFRADGAVRVEFSDDSSLLLSTHYLPDVVISDKDGALPLLACRDLSPREEEAFRFAALCYQAEKAALGLIARAEQSALALTAKLQRRRFAGAVVRAVVSRLLDQDLLNDGRYAEFWVRSRLAARKAQTPQQLLAALGKKGIDRKSSLNALEQAIDPETEYALLLRYLEKTRIIRSEGKFFLRTQLKHEGFSPAVLERYFDEAPAE
ncbi:MAG: recombination regulator RecX [Treponema sp.]|nr:recombination regulator RecX [Treponema sp.]